MAKRGSGMNLSAEIRRYIEANPSAMPKDIRAGLSAQGIEVTPGLVSAVKYGTGSRKEKKKTKREAKASNSTTATASAASAPAQRGRPPAKSGSSSLTATQLFDVKKIVDQLGGVARAREALEALERLR